MTGQVILVLVIFFFAGMTSLFFQGGSDWINPGKFTDASGFNLVNCGRQAPYTMRVGDEPDSTAGEIWVSGGGGYQNMDADRAAWLGWREGQELSDDELVAFQHERFSPERARLSTVELLFTPVDGQLPVAGFVRNWVTVLLLLALLTLGAGFFRRCANAEGPFRPECVRALRCLSAATGLLAIAPGLLALVVITAASLLGVRVEGGYDLFLVDVRLLLAAFLLFALSRVFEYGCLLQADDDGLV